MASDGEDSPAAVDFGECSVCGRTFNPQSLRKHVNICSKNATKRRKVFDSLRQRVEGTDLALFHMPTFKKPAVPPSKIPAPQPAAPVPTPVKPKSIPKPPKPAVPVRPPKEETHAERVRSCPAMNERCPHCERQFGLRSFERHEQWCRNKHSQLPAVVLQKTNSEAKERLDARIKYRAPSFIRRTVKEKYQPGSKELKDIKEPKDTKEPKDFKEPDPKPALGRTGSLRRTMGINPTTSAKLAPTPAPKKLPARRETSGAWDQHITKRRGYTVTEISNTTTPTNTNINNNKSKTTSDTYNPFLTAERQLLELLECNDFKPYHKSANIKNIRSPKQYKPLIASTPKSKKRQSVIDPPTDFKDTRRALEDDIDFEMLENFINDNFGNDELMHQLDLDTISLDSCSTKNIDSTNSYFDDMSIDPRLINDFDNLSIPDHLEDMLTRCQDDKTDVSNSIFYSLNSSGVKSDDYPPKAKSDLQLSPVTCKSDDEAQNTPETPKLDKTEEPEEMKCLFSAGELFSPDDEIYEEYKKLEETYIIERGEQHSRNTDAQNTDNAGQAVCADSAYGSLNRSPRTKIRSKVMLLSPLEPAFQREAEVDGDTTITASAESNAPNAGGDSIKEPKLLNPAIAMVATNDSYTQVSPMRGIVFAKFCHQCGKNYPVATAKFCVWCGHERLLL